MPQETYEEFRERIFGTPYLVWHDGPDGSALRFLMGDKKENAFVMLLEGLAEGDHVAIEGLAIIDPVRALPYIREAYECSQQRLSRVALADFLRQHDPDADLKSLATASSPRSSKTISSPSTRLLR